LSHDCDAELNIGEGTNSVKVLFENDFQQKLMVQNFEAPTTIGSSADVLSWRSQWTAGLKPWHSPYKLLVDCTNLQITANDAKSTEAFAVMMRFFEGLFLRKAAGFGLDPDKGHERLPFPVFKTEDEALAELGVRSGGVRKAPGDFRSTIQIQNHFQQHVVEVSFAEPVTVTTREQIETLKSKLTNNLMQWHSKWSLLFDCTNLQMDPGIHPDFGKAERLLRGFFMKTVIGYAPSGPKETYPFPTWRARHAAVAQLEAEGKFSGDDASCRSKAPKA
jgi:hypothetical protein